MSDQKLFVPPTVRPPTEVLSLPRILFHLIRNPLETWRQDFYEEPSIEIQKAGRQTLFVMSSNLIKRVLISQADDFKKSRADRKILGQALGDGILIAEQNKWKWQRRIVAPLFRHEVILSAIPNMVEAAENLLASWNQKVSDSDYAKSSGGLVRWIDRDMAATTFGVIQNTMLLGHKAFDSLGVANNMTKYLKHVSWIVAYDLIDAPEWLPFPGKLQMRRSAMFMRQQVADLVKDRRSRHSKSDNPAANNLLGKLLDARDPDTGDSMSDELIVDNLLTFLTAGHETTALALTWSLYLIAKVPEWQSRILNEVERVAGSVRISSEHVKHLVITEQVIKEAMRLYPPASVVSRRSVKATRLHNLQIQSDAVIMMPIFVIHRHRLNWNNPNAFDPERFAPGQDRERPRHAFMPFGAGRRSCIGASFALLEATVILATLVRRIHFECLDGTNPMPLLRVTLRPRGGMPLKIKFR